MNSTRFAVSGQAVCIAIVLLAMQSAVSQSNPAPPPATRTTVPENVAASDAAERHIKRTACVKDAKAKKLVGEQKNNYIKNCLASPPAS